MIIKAATPYGNNLRPYDMEGNRIRDALEADTEAMTCVRDINRDLEGVTVPVSKFTVYSRASANVVAFFADLGIYPETA
jgi:hypothetical protein